MPVETVRLGRKSRDQLIRLKRITGIDNWNILCRWAFCISLKEPNVPPIQADPAAESSVEMTWKTFGGRYDDLYAALLKQRCLHDGIELTDQNLSEQLRLHISRGLGYLQGDRSLKNIADLCRCAMEYEAVENSPGHSEA